MEIRSRHTINNRHILFFDVVENTWSEIRRLMKYDKHKFKDWYFDMCNWHIVIELKWELVYYSDDS